MLPFRWKSLLFLSSMPILSAIGERRAGRCISWTISFCSSTWEEFCAICAMFSPLDASDGGLRSTLIFKFCDESHFESNANKDLSVYRSIGFLSQYEADLSVKPAFDSFILMLCNKIELILLFLVELWADCGWCESLLTLFFLPAPNLLTSMACF